MKHVFVILSSVCGFFLALFGLFALSRSIPVGVCFIAMSLFLLPPARKAVYALTNRQLSFTGRFVSLFALFILSGFFMVQTGKDKTVQVADKESEEQEKAMLEVRQKKIDYFNSYREEIITSSSLALSQKKYQEVIEKTSEYLPSNDKELQDIHNKAKSALTKLKEAEYRAQREARTAELVAKLREVPVSEFAKNKRMYQQLVNINPENSKYQEKLNFYSRKLNEKMLEERKEQQRLERERKERIIKFGKVPTQSAWDGSYIVVENYLKRAANDPDSIEVDGCTKVYHTENGWLVGCDYRGRNAFGALVRQSNWFTIVHGQVLQMHDASAYKP